MEVLPTGFEPASLRLSAKWCYITPTAEKFLFSSGAVATVTSATNIFMVHTAVGNFQ